MYANSTLVRGVSIGLAAYPLRCSVTCSESSCNFAQLDVKYGKIYQNAFTKDNIRNHNEIIEQHSYNTNYNFVAAKLVAIKNKSLKTNSSVVMPT